LSEQLFKARFRDTAFNDVRLNARLHRMLEPVRVILNARTPCILLLARNRLRCLDGHEGDGPAVIVAEAWQRVLNPSGQDPVNSAAKVGQPWIIDQSSALGIAGLPRRDKVWSLLGLPLFVRGRVVGVVHVGTFCAWPFSEEDYQLIEIVGRRVASAIDRSHSHESGAEEPKSLAPVSQQLFNVQEIERGKLARELHDEIGQTLTLASLTLHDVKASAGAAAQASLSDCCQIVDKALDQVRSLSLKLRPSLLDELGLESAFRWYLDRLAARTGLTATFDCPAPLGRFHSEIETACYRVVQEALTNVVRHARAKQVWVTLALGCGELQCSVRDDGVGFDVRDGHQRAVRGESYGLVSMEERVKLLA
jgi:signal transduction histidine kinase